MAITYNKLAADVPAVQASIAYRSLKAAYDSPTGTALSARNIQVGNSAEVQPSWNENAERIDQAFTTGNTGGVYAVRAGLALSTNLTSATVAPGVAVLNGLVELAAATTVALSTGDNYLWFRQDKQVVVVANSLAPPTGGVPAVYLGHIFKGNPDIDLSGVIQARGLGFRKTADTNAPTDTPPGGILFFALTLGGMYLWDGESYKTFSNEEFAVFFGAMPHDATDTTPHDSWAPDGGVHVTAADRDAIADATTASTAAAANATSAVAASTAALAAASAAATLAATAVQNDDARLTNPRTPTAHAASHRVPDGSDPLLLEPSQINNLLEFVVDAFAAAATAGSNMTITYDDATGKVTFSSTGGSGSTSPLVVEDANGSYEVEKLVFPGSTGTYDAGTKTYTLGSISDS